MICYQCGTEMGDKLGLCDRCMKAKAIDPATVQAILDQRAQEEKKLSAKSVHAVNWLHGPKGALVLVVVGFVILLPIMFVLNPALGIPRSGCLSLSIICAMVSFFFWAKMWMELLVEEPVIAILAFFLPIAVYTLVRTYPERMMKPFLAHLGAAAVAILAQVALIHL